MSKSERETLRTTAFDKQLIKLEKKYTRISEQVEEFLAKCAKDGVPSTSQKIPGVKGKPVYKDRFGLNNAGKRDGARIIYYCDECQVVSLFVYSKANKSDVSIKEIQSALDAAGLI